MSKVGTTAARAVGWLVAASHAEEEDATTKRGQTNKQTNRQTDRQTERERGHARMRNKPGKQLDKKTTETKTVDKNRNNTKKATTSDERGSIVVVDAFFCGK